MVSLILCKHRFTIVSADHGRHKVDHYASEIRKKPRIHCVYLTHSVRAAVEMQEVATRASIRIYRATDLADARILIRIAEARVILVDLHFACQNLEGLLDTLHRACPRAAIIVVALEIDADRWQDVVRFGGFDMVLRPFSQQELTVVLDAADEYATRQLTPEARARRLAAIHSVIRDLVTGARAQGYP